MNSMNESGNYESEQEELMILMEQMQTTNERLQTELKGLQQKYGLLQYRNSQQETQIQTLLSDKQKLSEQVRKLMLQIQELQSSNQTLKLQVAQQAEQIERLNESDKQLSEANKMKKETEEQAREVTELYRASQKNELRLQREKAELQQEKAKLIERIEKSAEEKAKQMVQQIRDNSEAKQKRVNNFAVAAIWIQMVYSICVTGAWISDHTGVFVGQTGVSNFFVSVGSGIVGMCNGIGYVLNNAVETLQGSVGDLGVGLIIYGLCTVLGLLVAFLGIWKGIPKLKEKFRKILNTYRQNGVVGYKKAMTVSLCVIALCFAILLAEYAMVNVIGVWLLMSVGFNLTYHLATYER